MVSTHSLSKHESNNALQYDAYHPLQWPPGERGHVSQHALGRVCVYPSMHWTVCPGYVCLANGVSAGGGDVYLRVVSAGGMSAQVGVSAKHPCLVNRMTDACENITLPQLRSGR